MGKVKWIVQRNLNNADRVLSFIFNEQNIEAEYVDIIPFSGEVPYVKIEPDTKVVVRGSTTMMVGAKKHSSWVPGVWHNDNFKPSWYKQSYGKNFLNFNGKAVSLEDVLNCYKEYDCEKLFIRANSDYKELSGDVYTKEQALILINKIKADDFYFGNQLECFVAPLNIIVEEYRLIIVDNQVISGTSYKINDELKNIPAPEKILKFGQEIAHLGPDAVYCLDVGILLDGTIGVIECNCFNGSGIYGDHENIILKITEFVKKL